MFNAFAAVRSAVTRGFHAIGEDSFSEAHVLLSPRLRPGDAEIATAYPLKVGKDAEALCERLGKTDVSLLGASLISKSEVRGGHILFSLTNEAYEAITHRINATADARGLFPLSEAADTLSYAYMRMLTLLGPCGKDNSVLVDSFGFGDDESMRRALWGCFGMAEKHSQGEMVLLAEYIAIMSLTMFSSIETSRLVETYNNTKQVSFLIASCLSSALKARRSQITEV